MLTSRNTLFAGIKVAIVAVITVLLFILVINAMRNPVDAQVVKYRADFTDASGLHENGDVRFRGKRIGKITAVDLQHDADGKPFARVEFTMEDQQKLTSTTKLAIKYQNLTGVRYLDVRPGGDEPGQMVSHASTSQTVPSFDITGLFNGLQPVLTTMDADEVNQFSENAIALLQGDGSGLGPMLDSTQKLADYAKNRQQLISTLTANLARIADTMGGRSPQVMGVPGGRGPADQQCDDGARRVRGDGECRPGPVRTRRATPGGVGHQRAVQCRRVPPDLVQVDAGSAELVPAHAECAGRPAGGSTPARRSRSSARTDVRSSPPPMSVCS